MPAMDANFFCSSYLHRQPQALQYQHSADRHDRLKGDGMGPSRTLETKTDWALIFLGSEVCKRSGKQKPGYYLKPRQPLT